MAKKELKAVGVAARKAERERKAKVLELKAKGELIPVDLLHPICDPEKNPTPQEKEGLLPPPALIQALQQAQANAYQPPIDPQTRYSKMEKMWSYD